jgi:hypothetical protein
MVPKLERFQPEGMNVRMSGGKTRRAGRLRRRGRLARDHRYRQPAREPDASRAAALTAEIPLHFGRHGGGSSFPIPRHFSRLPSRIHLEKRNIKYGKLGGFGPKPATACRSTPL